MLGIAKRLEVGGAARNGNAPHTRKGPFNDFGLVELGFKNGAYAMAFCPNMGNDGNNLRHGGVIANDHGTAFAIGIEELIGVLKVPTPHNLGKGKQDRKNYAVHCPESHGVLAHSMAVIVLVG